MLNVVHCLCWTMSNTVFLYHILQGNLMQRDSIPCSSKISICFLHYSKELQHYFLQIHLHINQFYVYGANFFWIWFMSSSAKISLFPLWSNKSYPAVYCVDFICSLQFSYILLFKMNRFYSHTQVI